MKRVLTILLLSMSISAAHGQYLRLAGDTASAALYLDAGRIWNYNLYEHSRWGAGLRLHAQRVIVVDAYVGYGTFDEKWKYGIGITERFNKPLQMSLYQSFIHDYFAVGNRRPDHPSEQEANLLGGFWSHRMTEQYRIALGYRWRTHRTAWAVEAVYARDRRLFNNYNLLYINNNDSIGFRQHLYGRLLMYHPIGLRLQAEAGPRLETARLFAQYSQTTKLNHFILNTFAQCGISAPQSDYENMFDLGGTWGAPLYVGNGLVTARPNEFTANGFALLSLRLRTAKPLFNIFSSLFSLGSNPVPFVGFNAAWGAMWDQDANGQRQWQEMSLQAPYYGLFEPIAGIEGIVHWGAVDWGIALTYRLVPNGAPYRLDNPLDNLTLLFTAKLHQ